MEPLIVFFDGQCPFCVGWVKFLLDRDGYDNLRFASLQSDWSRDFFEKENLPHPGLESIVIWDGITFSFGSDAILEILAVLPGLWKFLRHGRAIPVKLRETLYGWVARNRLNWMDSYDTCWVPKEEEKAKFFDLTPSNHLG